MFPGERRASRRFPIQQPVYFKIPVPKGTPQTGTGEVIDISSGGVLFRTDQALQPGKKVQLSVDWPAHLDGSCLLKLVAEGQVLRSEGNTAVVTIDKYEFRTRGKVQ